MALNQVGKLLSNHVAWWVNCNETFLPRGSLSVTKTVSTSGVLLTADRYMCMYRIFSENSSPTVARKICHLVTSTIAKMTKDDQGWQIFRLSQRNIRVDSETSECFVGAFLETKWRVLNSLYGQQFKAITLVSVADAVRLGIILTEGIRECWCPRFGRLEEVCNCPVNTV